MVSKQDVASYKLSLSALPPSTILPLFHTHTHAPNLRFRPKKATPDPATLSATSEDSAGMAPRDGPSHAAQLCRACVQRLSRVGT